MLNFAGTQGRPRPTRTRPLDKNIFNVCMSPQLTTASRLQLTLPGRSIPRGSCYMDSTLLRSTHLLADF